MPTEIVIVRHGLCTGNAADQASRKGNHSLFSHGLRQQKSTEWPLLPLGVIQSQETGKKIMGSIAENFDHYLTSDITRSIETARGLGFKKAVWEIDTLLRERDWGGIENLPYPERNELFKQAGISSTEDSLEWRPPGGESMLFILRQVESFLKMARQKFHGKKLLIVSHGAPVQAMRVLQHKVVPENYVSFISGNNYIRNCHIFHYFSPKKDVGITPMYLFERSMFLTADGTWSESIQKIE